MALYTNFPTENPFWGGITSEYGTGLHEDMDATTGEKETIPADYLNRIELRIQRIERFLNQLEHEVLWPSGRVATSGFSDDTPASGNYYLSSRLDRMASGMNWLVTSLVSSGSIVGEVPYNPLYTGDM